MRKQLHAIWIGLGLLILIIFPSLTFGNEDTFFSNGQKTSYIYAADGRLFGFYTFKVSQSRDGLMGENWFVQGHGICKYREPGKKINTSLETIGLKLSEDYRLLELKAEAKINGQVAEKLTIQYKCNYYEYVDDDRVGKKRVIHKKIPASSPLYFFDTGYPWTVELVIKNKIAKAVLADQVMTGTGIEKVELLPEKSHDGAKKIFSVDQDTHIYVDPDLTVSQIKTGNNQVVSKTRQKQFGTKIEGLVIQPVVTGNIFWTRPELIDYLHIKINDKTNHPKDAKTLETLGSPRQIFQGIAKTDGSHGEVFINAKPNPMGDSIPFPIQEHWQPDLTAYLTPQDMIESAHPQIVAQAKKITAGLQSIGAAARAIATWVNQNIQGPDGTGESALETLRSRKGVCRHCARLMIALCRAVDIPARYMSGVVYVWPGFSRHAWVEVYFGPKDGWAAMDPSSGQVEFVDATHIALTDTDKNWFYIFGGGTVIEILDYRPTTVTPVVNERWADVKKLWQDYKRFDYNFLENGKATGAYRARLVCSYRQRLVLDETLQIPGNPIKMTSRLTMGDQGQAICYRSKGIWNGKEMDRKYDYKEQKIRTCSLYGNQKSRENIVRIGKNESQADLFGFFEWGLVINRLMDGVTGPTVHRITIYTPDQGYMNLDVAMEPAQIDFLGTKVAGMECEINSYPYARKISITKEGIVTRIEMPDIKVSAVLDKVVRN